MLVHILQAMEESIDQPSRYHKEESAARIQADAVDRSKLQQKLQHCVNALDPTEHLQELFNIVTGEIASTSVNVHKALELGKESLQAYEEKLPERFHVPIISAVLLPQWQPNGNGSTYKKVLRQHLTPKKFLSGLWG